MKTRFLIKVQLTAIIFSMLLFLGAGTLNYMQGWLFLAMNIISGFMNYWTIRNNEALMNERASVGANAKSWDKKILGISALVYVVTIVLAGLDAGRFHWSPEFQVGYYALGIVLSIMGQLIFLNARSQNRFFSSVVRIQDDRNHAVCDQGLYAIVRHPGYVGMGISLLSIPCITGSVWSFIPTAIALLLLVIRTAMEDNTLKAELAGYMAYAAKTKYKLIPGIW